MGVGQVASATSTACVLDSGSPESQGIDATYLERLYQRIEAHIEAGWYPEAAIALARRGTLVAAKTFGIARLATDAEPAAMADEETLWLLYSHEIMALAHAAVVEL